MLRTMLCDNFECSDIRRIHICENNKFRVTIVTRITKGDNDWNQAFNLHGLLEYNEKEVNQMDAVYWLNKLLKNAHKFKS